MFPRWLQDFSGWSFQMKVWTLMIQRNLMIPNYSMIPAIWWSIGSMDFNKPKVYGDTSITDGLVFMLSSESSLWRGAKSISDGIFVLIFMIVILSAQKLSMAHIRAGISWHRPPPHLEQNSPPAPLKWTRQSITIITIVIVIAIVIRKLPSS